MALVSVKQALKDAQAGGYALALFDTYDMHATDGIFQAFEEKRAHAFIGLYGGFFEQPNAARTWRTSGRPPPRPKCPFR